jgi:hypothetical protein
MQQTMPRLESGCRSLLRMPGTILVMTPLEGSCTFLPRTTRKTARQHRQQCCTLLHRIAGTRQTKLLQVSGHIALQHMAHTLMKAMRRGRCCTILPHIADMPQTMLLQMSGHIALQHMARKLTKTMRRE